MKLIILNKLCLNIFLSNLDSNKILVFCLFDDFSVVVSDGRGLWKSYIDKSSRGFIYLPNCQNGKVKSVFNKKYKIALLWRFKNHIFRSIICELKLNMQINLY